MSPVLILAILSSLAAGDGPSKAREDARKAAAAMSQGSGARVHPIGYPAPTMCIAVETRGISRAALADMRRAFGRFEPEYRAEGVSLQFITYSGRPLDDVVRQCLDGGPHDVPRDQILVVVVSRASAGTQVRSRRGQIRLDSPPDRWRTPSQWLPGYLEAMLHRIRNPNWMVAI